MIRRNHPDGFLLIPQNDHAALSGLIASTWGNETWPPPEPLKEVLMAIHFHDAGWPMHDERPTINNNRIPTTFYEMEPEVDFRLWSASIAGASAHGGAMAGLIVSWHFSGLADSLPIPPDDEETQNALTEFRNSQRDRRFEFCRQLNISSSLAEVPLAPEKDNDWLAVYNFCILRVCDWLSLMLCDDQLPAFIRDTPPTLDPEGRHRVQTKWIEPSQLGITPWPFKVDRLSLSIQGRLVENKSYEDHCELQVTYDNAEVETLPFLLCPLS
jgi:hypothetical protein